jgi:hypothetical protein
VTEGTDSRLSLEPCPDGKARSLFCDRLLIDREVQARFGAGQSADDRGCGRLDGYGAGVRGGELEAVEQDSGPL